MLLQRKMGLIQTLVLTGSKPSFQVKRSNGVETTMTIQTGAFGSRSYLKIPLVSCPPSLSHPPPPSTTRPTHRHHPSPLTLRSPLFLFMELRVTSGCIPSLRPSEDRCRHMICSPRCRRLKRRSLPSLRVTSRPQQALMSGLLLLRMVAKCWFTTLHHIRIRRSTWATQCLPKSIPTLPPGIRPTSSILTFLRNSTSRFRRCLICTTLLNYASPDSLPSRMCSGVRIMLFLLIGQFDFS